MLAEKLASIRCQMRENRKKLIPLSHWDPPRAALGPCSNIGRRTFRLCLDKAECKLTASQNLPHDGSDQDLLFLLKQ